jgi:hypothetical protein
MNLLIPYLFTISAVAGASVLWRNWLVQHASVEEKIKAVLGAYANVLVCGSCFTYWLSLAASLFSPALRDLITDPVSFIALWMSVSYGSVLLRFSYVLIQEKVSILVHHHDTIELTHR